MDFLKDRPSQSYLFNKNADARRAWTSLTRGLFRVRAAGSAHYDLQ